MRRRSAIRNSIEYGLARVAVATLEWAPLPVAWALGRVYAGALDRAVPRLRRTALRNLELAYPEMDPAERARIAGGVFRSIARLLVVFARLPRIHGSNLDGWIRYEGFEHFKAAKARGRGVLFATAHLGNWELSAFAHALMAEPMHVVVRPLDNPLIDEFVERRRMLTGNRAIGKKDFARAILAALKRNEAVGILIDQNAAPEHGVFVDFFGIAACAGTGFAKLAAHSGAAIVPGFALWSAAERRYVLRFYPPLQATGDAAADTAQLQKLLEGVIREYPDQWLWIHRRWKTRPAGEPTLYG
ncbi:MAG TPA: lysophospholipid acyltransferase family protein [Bryobacteraceae bacterium]|nr:lysophospholipid acyltransferase family protein [Bryobacteraceae bacterium]